MMKSDIPTDKPFLAYTRKWGWVKATPVHPGDDYSLRHFVVAFTHPMRIRLLASEVLAVAPLPPAPDAAL